MARLVHDLATLTINVKGLKHPQKRVWKIKRLAHLIRQFNTDVVFLQETHFDETYEADKLLVDLGIAGLNCGAGFHSLARPGEWAGTTTLITSDRWTVVGNTTDQSGRMLTVDVNRGDTYHSLVNVYAPSGSANYDRPVFFYELLNFIRTTARHDIIVAGDLNVTLDDRDRTEIPGATRNRNVGRAELQQIVDQFNLTDTYLTNNPTRQNVDMTYQHRPNQGSRIDCIFTATNNTVTHHEHIHDTLQFNFTDHKGVYAIINAPFIIKHKSPHYKLNDTLLDEDEYIQQVNILIDYYLYPTPDDGLRELWDFFKDKVKMVSIEISKTKHRQKMNRLTFLKQEIDTFLRQGREENGEFLGMKEELDSLLEYKYNGAAIRCKQKLIGDETATAAFVALESNIQRDRQIRVLEDDDGVLHNDNDKIIEMLEDYYRDLFTQEPTDTARQDEFLQYAKILTDQQRDMLEIPVTQAHLLEALNTLDTTSTPGPDGLTYNWYKTFFPKIAPFYVKLIEECLENEFLSNSQNMNFISLMLKDPNHPELIKNYRPLALLNSDYKIMTKTLAIRATQIMHIIINSDQAASVKGRKITDHNHYIRDIIIHAQDKQIHACALSIDQMKAFDRVDHTWLHRLLEHMNFGPYFRKFIRTIYAGARACVLANHTLSSVIDITRGVRQGDPLSSFLYIITLEPFLEKIRRDERIKGIKLPGGIEQKLLAFADDVDAFPANDDSILRILKTAEHYGEASGSKLNKPKTKMMALGSFVSRHDDLKNYWVKEIKMLGIVYRAHRDDPGVNDQWEGLSVKVKKIAGQLKYKNASIFGKATLANTLLTPKLNYLIQTLDIPKKVLTKINKDIRSLIFHGTIAKITDARMTQPKLRGGINLQDIQTKIDTYRIHLIHTIKSPEYKNPLPKYYCAWQLRNHVQANNNTPRCTVNIKKLPKFYQNLINTIKNHDLVALAHTTTKLTYQTLIQQKFEILGPREMIHARHYDDFDYSEPFKNLHKKLLTPQQKNITFRILFNITPTSKGLARRQQKIYPCPICTQARIQETEEHLFYHCPHTHTAKDILKTYFTNAPAHIHINAILYKAIFTNTVPPADRQTEDRQLIALAIYRQTIWDCRLKAKFNRKKFTQNAIKTKFKSKLDSVFK